MTLNICQLFKVRQNVEAGVSLVETPLTYIGTNDNAVIRIRPLPNGRFQVSDGGNADWFASTAGYDFESSSVAFYISEYAKLLDVNISDEGDVYCIARNEDELPIKILHVAQFSVSLYAKAVLRQAKTNSTFKEELREAIMSVMGNDNIQERYVVPNSHDVTVDYFISGGATPVYIVAASDKARLLEAELLSVQLKASERNDKVIAVVESQKKVGQSEYERSSYLVDKSLVFDKEQLPRMLSTMN